VSSEGLVKLQETKRLEYGTTSLRLRTARKRDAEGKDPTKLVRNTQSIGLQAQCGVDAGDQRMRVAVARGFKSSKWSIETSMR
jgi:hypothetical protein